MVDEHTPKQSFAPEPVNANFVTDRADSPCTDNVLPGVVTVRPHPALPLMRDLYAQGLSTAEIKAKLRTVTEAQVHNAVFGTCAFHRQANAGTPAPASTAKVSL